nr:MAG TPA: hypothetical protein [Caudoviricetes sp.]
MTAKQRPFPRRNGRKQPFLRACPVCFVETNPTPERSPL